MEVSRDIEPSGMGLMTTEEKKLEIERMVISRSFIGDIKLIIQRTSKAFELGWVGVKFNHTRTEQGVLELEWRWDLHSHLNINPVVPLRLCLLNR